MTVLKTYRALKPLPVSNRGFVRTSKLLRKEKKGGAKSGAFIVQRCQLLPVGRLTRAESGRLFLRASIAKGESTSQLSL